MRSNILISKAVRFWAAFDFSFGKAGFTLKFLTSRQSRVTRLAGARPFCLLRRHFPALRGITLASRGGFEGAVLFKKNFAQELLPRGISSYNNCISIADRQPAAARTNTLWVRCSSEKSPLLRLPCGLKNRRWIDYPTAVLSIIQLLPATRAKCSNLARHFAKA